MGNQERIDGAMAPYRTELEAMWGKEYPALRDYLAVATAPWRENAAVLRADLQRFPNGRTLILVGERAAEVNGSGMREEQFRAILQTVKLCEGAPYHILFTGGVYGLELSHGERPGMLLAGDFLERAGDTYLPYVSVEQFSQNTGHQARVIGPIVPSVGFTRIVVCIPIEHIARFAATLAFDLDQRKIAKPFCSFFFLGDGEWDDVIPQRKMTRAREAFGPIQGIDDPHMILASKLLGGEYGERYWKEQSPEHNNGYACGALPPSAMLEHYAARP